MTQPILHTPGGAAGEYAQLALRGPYVGCVGGCRYCYNHLTRPITVGQWRGNVRPLKGFTERLEKTAAKLAGDPRRVFMSFGCDPCQPLEDELGLTARALDILHKHGLAPHLLTKFGPAAARHFPALARHPRARFWTTLTTLDPERAARWEPGAPPPAARVEALMLAMEMGIDTGLSLEPTIYPPATLRVIEEVGPLARHVSVGKLNHMTLGEVRAVDPAAAKPAWGAFRAEAVRALEAQGRSRLLGPHRDPGPGVRTYYIKRDLEAAG